MIELLVEHSESIEVLCKRYGIGKLEVFGSATSGNFDLKSSDIDLIVELQDKRPGLAKRFFDFQSELEKLLGRPVDFVFGPEIRNPYLRQSIDESRELLYESADREVAA